ncbi:Predicted transcriptional regulator, XRE family [Paraburkholderia xenovorans LB400]|uniref:Predicted transcriptional regulator, XRE family n=1 Tax=Paraburkholderia xenovorans (strain LB400) TaxID=266265 RepID=Q13ZC2_PARXL|nr:Predicted transcriptional regulator, XRE family [Paraburkholderia xenovorans LB400]
MTPFHKVRLKLTLPRQTRGVSGLSNIEQLARSIGAAIAARRKALGMTQERLSELIQIEQSSLSRIERGTLIPSLERLASIAEELECGLADLFYVGGVNSHDRAARVHEKLSHLTPSQQEIFERLIDDALALLETPQGRRTQRANAKLNRKGT